MQNLKKVYQQAKAEGITAQQIYTTTKVGILKRAKDDGWSPAGTAATLADIVAALRGVYGKRATKDLTK